MEQGDIEMIKLIYQTHSDGIKQFIKTSMDDVKFHIAESSAQTDRQIAKLNGTLTDHNGRLKKVEDEHQKQAGILKTLKWCGKHWYIPASVFIIILLILIPLVDFLGLKGLISLIK